MVNLFCLHGFTGRGSSFDRMLAHLPAHATAVCPDLLGHGRPPAGDGLTRFTDEVDRLARLVPDTNPRPVLIGYSLGARVGLALLARHGRRFVGAVLASGRLSLTSAEERTARIAADRDRAARLRRDGLEAFVDTWESLPMFANHARLPGDVRAAHRRRRMSNDAMGLAHALDVLGLGHMPDDRAALASVALPVRILAGDDDPRFIREALHLTHVLPHASLHRVPDCGHDLLTEAPHIVAAAIHEV